MNTILLQPNDILFFRDGRPMTGSLAGHGAAWPLPNVINAAFHAAFHRAELDGDGTFKLHAHRRGARGFYAEDAKRDRKFGSLVTAGPFPVDKGGDWFFPRPLDLKNATVSPALLPADSGCAQQSSLPEPLVYSVGNRLPPAKESPAKAWLSLAAYQRYLKGEAQDLDESHALNDCDFSDTEHAIGIAIDPATGTTGQGDAAGQIYSAHYLRLREGWRLGVCATALDKDFEHPVHGKDLVRALLNGGGHQIIVGGQQRICSAMREEESALHLPIGKMTGFHSHRDKWLVKWVLLSPAVWPAIEADPGRSIHAHGGGWLPNWVDQETGAVMLKGGETVRQPQEGRLAWRERVRNQESIAARLVSAIVPRPLVISGWSLADEAGDEPGGAQSTHLAVPAGAVYYFEADSAQEAVKLATALNWHGSDAQPTTIRYRRSTLLGEKGFGLGVCGTWKFYEESNTHD